MAKKKSTTKSKKSEVKKTAQNKSVKKNKKSGKKKAGVGKKVKPKRMFKIKKEKKQINLKEGARKLKARWISKLNQIKSGTLKNMVAWLGGVSERVSKAAKSIKSKVVPTKVKPSKTNKSTSTKPGKFPFSIEKLKLGTVLKRKFRKSTTGRDGKKKKSKRRVPAWVWWTTGTMGVILLLAIGIISYFFVLKDLPSPERLATNPYPVSTKILDRNGTLLYEIFADQNRTPVDLDSLPEYVKQATIAIEDKDFYKHHGLSISGISRAGWKNLKYFLCQWSVVSCQSSSFQGGSTITQQLVKNTLLTPERTWQRKAKEALLTLAVETKYSKDDILEMYLNHVPYGGTAYGIESAAQTYFDKPAQELTISEATVLAGLPAAPTRFSPYGVDPEAYKIRQRAVVRRMVEEAYISEDEASKILETELNFTTQKNLIHAPHFVLWIKDLLVKEYGQQMVEQGGLIVTTTLDLEAQKMAEEIVSSEVEQLEDYKATNGAVLITVPWSGQILAMVGSANYFNREIDGNVNLTLRLRQPGSSIKPLNYAMGIDSGEMMTSSLIADIPTCFSVTGQSLYCPVNYDGQYHGPVQLRYALANSYNVPAVRVLAKNGLKDFVATASAMGIKEWDDPSKFGLSLTLGGGEVRMVDLATAYGVLANMGNKVGLSAIMEVKDYKGNVLNKLECDKESELERLPDILTDSEENEQPQLRNYCNPKQIISPEAAYLITNILTDSGARAPTFGNNLNISGHPEVAVKTGTTNDLRDNWTVGYAPDFLVAAWVGNFDNSPMSRIASGITGAAPIWKQVMGYLVEDYELEPTSEKLKNGETEEQQNSTENEQDSSKSVNDLINESTEWIRPEKIVDLPVCVESGLAVSPDPNHPCTPRPEVFIEDQIPQHHTTSKRPWPIDKTTGQPAFERTPPENIEMQDKLIYFDILGSAICVDCTPPEDPVIIKYPLEDR